MRVPIVLRRSPLAIRLLALVSVLGLAVAACDWLTYHGNGARSGAFPAASSPTTLQRFWSATLDGAVYASPVIHSGKVFVATEGGSIYAFATYGKQLWRSHLANPVQLSDLASRGAPCGNINPLGITGTPVYDPGTKSLFAVAERLSSGVLQHVLFRLNPDTGAITGQQVVVPPRGNPAAHQQRGALALTGNRVLVPFGGLAGDCGNYIGSIVGVPTAMTSARVSYAIPTTREAGIWTPPGPTVLSDGTVLATSGNGASTSGAYDGSDSVVRLSSDLKLIDRFAPTTWPADNAADLDLGSAGPAVTSNGYVVQSGKRGVTYVLRAGHLGGIGGQVSSASGCAAFGGAAVTGSTVYLPCTSGVRRADIASNGAISLGWQASGIAGSPVVYGNSVLAISQSQGRLYLLDPGNGHPRSSLSVGGLSRFATPALDTGRAYLGTLNGIVAVNVK